MFEKNSRYFNLDKNFHFSSDGHKIVYIKRRFVPKIREGSYPQELIINGDRIDLLAVRLFGEPDEYWRICDVNYELNPRMIFSVPGTLINIPEILDTPS